MIKSVLVIDDNEAILVSLKYVLTEIAEKVFTLNNPEKALSILAQEEISVVLLDMNFAIGLNTGTEGLKWLKTLNEHHPELPVVLMTAYADIELAVKGLKMGASDFVTKPWDNENSFTPSSLPLTAKTRFSHSTKLKTIISRRQSINVMETSH